MTKKITILKQHSIAEKEFPVLTFAEFESKYPDLVLVVDTSAKHPEWGSAWYDENKELVSEQWDTSG